VTPDDLVLVETTYKIPSALKLYYNETIPRASLKSICQVQESSVS
jgi:hypothetical protein